MSHLSALGGRQLLLQFLDDLLLLVDQRRRRLLQRRRARVKVLLVQELVFGIALFRKETKLDLFCKTV